VRFTEALSADHMTSRLRLFALVIMDCRPGLALSAAPAITSRTPGRGRCTMSQAKNKKKAGKAPRPTKSPRPAPPGTAPPARGYPVAGGTGSGAARAGGPAPDGAASRFPAACRVARGGAWRADGTGRQGILGLRDEPRAWRLGRPVTAALAALALAAGALLFAL
jgi:hypothetical protein